MKSVQLIFLLFAIAAACSMMAIGIFIAEENVLGISLSVMMLIIIMGFGFATKKKMRERGRL
jgi:hypothetical protein